MRRTVAAALLAALVACTTGGPAAETPSPDAGEGNGPRSAASSLPSPSAVSIPVVVRPSPTTESLLLGMRLAADAEATIQLDMRPLDAGEGAAALRSAVGEHPAAVVVVGDAGAVAAARPDIEATGVPVVLAGGDLYTSRSLFRFAFQTSVPVAWQAAVIASYLIEDRGAERVLVLCDPEDTEPVESAFATAFAREGGEPPLLLPASGPWMGPLSQALPDVDAVVAISSPETVSRALERLAVADASPRLVIGPAALGTAQFPPGTGVVYPYTWAGWADMLPRVQEFRAAFRAANDRDPSALEQEGYDVVMALADALERTGGTGGEALVGALEAFREETYSALPIRLGPDDHVLAEQSHLGVLAVTDPAGAPPGEAFGPVPWRPVMRTFTTDGEKVNLWDPDKRIFFPFWHRKRPTPKYWRSEFGIVTRADDPVH